MEIDGQGSAAAGWHPDAADPTVTRYWDGTRWTAVRRWDGTAWVDEPIAADQPPAAASVVAPAAPGATPAAPVPAASGTPWTVADASAPTGFVEVMKAKPAVLAGVIAVVLVMALVGWKVMGGGDDGWSKATKQQMEQECQGDGVTKDQCACVVAKMEDEYSEKDLERFTNDDGSFDTDDGRFMVDAMTDCGVDLTSGF